MATIDELTKQLEAAITRISGLEGELRNKPKEKAAEPAFDLVKFRNAFVLDPLGTMKALQIAPDHVEHVRNALIADKLGDAAPMNMRMLVAQGPQMMAAQTTADAVSALSRRLDDQDAQKATATKRESFKAIAADKTKYPNLSKAIAADPELANELDKHGGTVEEYAASKEASLTKLAAVFAPPAASVTAGNTGQSTQAKPTPLAGALGGDPPAIAQDKPGEWTREAYTKMRDEIVQKHQARAKV